MRISATWKWVALALLGLLIAGAVAVAASRLASEQIGIASESVSAGDRLAPVVAPAAQELERQKPDPGPEPAPPPETTDSDDHGGDDHGGDDDGEDDHGGDGDHSGHGGGGDDFDDD
jgi:hypothetical protein